jgi:hypothetical protein
MSDAASQARAARKVAIWFEGEQEFDLLPFIFFVSAANASQESFQFNFPDPTEELTFARALECRDSNRPYFDDRYDIFIFITAAYMEGNLFFIEDGRLVHITTHGWQENFSPPSVFEYLFHSIMCGTLYALTSIEHHRTHTMGCQFEYTRVKELDRVDIALGYICKEHKEIIRSEMGPKILADIENLFKFSWLGKPDEHGTIAYKMKELFAYDLRKDSGYKKRFLERVQANIDTLWFDMAKELFKGFVLIVCAFLLFKFGLSSK